MEDATTTEDYVSFASLLAVYSVGLIFSKPAAVRLANVMRWPLRHAGSYKVLTKYSAPLIGLPLVAGLFVRAHMGWHWWLSGVCLVCLSVAFHGELLPKQTAIIQRFDQTFAAYHFAYHLWLAVIVGSVSGIVLLSCVVGFYFVAWIEAYTHVGVHVCATLAGLAILACLPSNHATSNIPFVLA